MGRRGQLPVLKGGASLAALALLCAASPAFAQTAQNQTDTAASAAGQDAQPSAPAAPASAPAGAATPADEAANAPAIVVTGFRQSLNAALSVKRNSVASVDAIVAEDIAKFPDQNLAESLQRIPGIAITREGGEGRQITVRGLGPGYTQVRLNGMETIATSAGEGGPNRGRDFDFNVFASELFQSIVVHKTAEATLDEGSLGAVVDLNTGNPLSFKDGFTFVASAKGQYNDLSKDLGPRLAGLVAYKDPGGVWAASLSAAWSKYQILEIGNNTVRWQQARFNSVDGTPCFTKNGSGGAYIPSEACNDVALAFHPRIPRYGEISHDRRRLGLTGSFQVKPTDSTTVSIDGLYANYNETRREKWAEVLLRSNERGQDIRDYTIDPKTNNLVAATIDNAWARIENFRRRSFTKFYQVSGKVDQEFADNFHATLFGGFSRSEAKVPSETTIIFDDRDMNGYSYDYTDMHHPRLTFADSITDPSSFQFAEFRDRPSDVVNKFSTVKLDAKWDVNDQFSVLGGVFWRRYSFDTTEAARDSTYCAAFTCAPGAYGAPVTDAIANIYHLHGVSAPAGTTTAFVNPDIDAAADLIDLYNLPLNPTASNIRSVLEKDTGGYLQFNVKSSLFGLDYSADAGIRYIHTNQHSTGINNAQTVTVSRGYDDWLPSLNIALYPTRKLIIRAAIAKVMTRPGLGTLSPGGSVDGFNWKISFGNPYLDPTRATNFDLGIEYYFRPQSIISVALFKKDIESFPLSTTRTGTFASTGLPLSLILASSPAARDPEAQPWQINTTVNGPGATIKGVEFALQTPFNFLPAPFDKFGFIGNVTYVDSKVDYTLSPAATDPLTTKFPKLGDPVTITRPLLGLSRWSYNATLYYETDKFSLRGSLAYRSRYADGTSATGNLFEGWGPQFTVDASASYSITKWLDLTVEGQNLTDAYQERWVDYLTDRNYSYNHTGRTIMFGARLKL